MNPELLMLKGLIASLPADEREAIEKAAEALRNLIAEHGMTGKIALGLVGLEMQDDQN